MALKLGCLSFLFAWRFLKSYGYESLPTIYIKNISCHSVVFIIKLYIAFLSVCLQICSFVTFLFSLFHTLQSDHSFPSFHSSQSLTLLCSPSDPLLCFSLKKKRNRLPRNVHRTAWTAQEVTIRLGINPHILSLL